jgi:hypothetical protein
MYHDPVKRKRYSEGSTLYDPVDLFQELFPGEFAVMEAVKQGDYSNLPRLLQRIESYVIMYRVVGRVSRDHPTVPLFTVHDNIMTTPAYQGLVEKIIREECTKVVGTPPQIEGKLLLPSVALQTLERLRAMDPDSVAAELKEKQSENRRKSMKRKHRRKSGS